MQDSSITAAKPQVSLLKALGEDPSLQVGDVVRVSVRYPVGHYRVPTYVRGKQGTIEAVIAPAINNEDEGFGRNSGLKGYYYRVAIPLTVLWPGYTGQPTDGLRIEIFETWLERI